MQKFLQAFFVLLVLILVSFRANAQECGCDHVIDPPAERATPLILDGSAMGVQPGETVCLSAGFYMQIRFINFSGEPGNPVTIKNCGGLVQIGDDLVYGRWYAVDIVKSAYIRLTGSGDSGIKYGIKLGRSGDSGMKIGGNSTDTEIDHIEIGNANFAGILAKTDYAGNPPASASEMNNVNIHDNYIHDARGEGMYIGETRTPGQNFRHLEVWNNIIVRTGLDLFQVANVIEDVKVHHNVMYRGGLRNVLFQNKGVQIGDNSVGEYYNNFIIGSPSNSMIVMGSGDIDIHDNYMQGATDPAIFIDNRAVNFPELPISVRNNYIMEVRETVPFINVFNELNPIVISNNMMEGANVIVGYGSGAGAKVLHAGSTVGIIERAAFGDITADNFTLSEASPYSALGLMEDVSNRNGRPYIALIADQKFDAEIQRQIPVRASDPDGDALTLEAFNLPPFVSFTDKGDGSGFFSLAPQIQDIGVYYKVRVRVTDSKGGMNTQSYAITITDPYAFLATASSSTENNGPENTLDNNLGTRWESAADTENWIQYDLREDKLVTAVQIAFYNGGTAVSPFDIEISENGSDWNKVLSAQNSGASTDLENFPIAEVRARYLRIKGAPGVASSYSEVAIQCTTAPVFHPFGPVADVYSDSRKVFDHSTLKIRRWRSKAYLRFAVSGLNVAKAPVVGSVLKLTAMETGSGTLKVYFGDDSNWSESSGVFSLPEETALLKEVTRTFQKGQTYDVDLGKSVADNGFYNFILVLENSTETLSFSSSEGFKAPEFVVATLRGADASSEVSWEDAPQEVTPEVEAEMATPEIYPNPVRSEMNIHFKDPVEEQVKVEITDRTGKPIFQQSWMSPGQTVTIDLNSLNMQPGFYYVKVNQKGYAVKTLRIFKVW